MFIFTNLPFRIANVNLHFLAECTLHHIECANNRAQRKYSQLPSSPTKFISFIILEGTCPLFCPLLSRYLHYIRRIVPTGLRGTTVHCQVVVTEPLLVGYCHQGYGEGGDILAGARSAGNRELLGRVLIMTAMMKE